MARGRHGQPRRRGFGILGVSDLREVIPGASSPRGLNRVVLLDTRGRVVRAFEYGAARPLECRSDGLILFGSRRVMDLWDAHDAPAAYSERDADVFHFDKTGRLVATEEIDAGTLSPKGP